MDYFAMFFFSSLSEYFVHLITALHTHTASIFNLWYYLFILPDFWTWIAEFIFNCPAKVDDNTEKQICRKLSRCPVFRCCFFLLYFVLLFLALLFLCVLFRHFKCAIATVSKQTRAKRCSSLCDDADSWTMILMMMSIWQKIRIDIASNDIISEHIFDFDIK